MLSSITYKYVWIFDILKIYLLPWEIENTVEKVKRKKKGLRVCWGGGGRKKLFQSLCLQKANLDNSPLTHFFWKYQTNSNNLWPIYYPTHKIPNLYYIIIEVWFNHWPNHQNPTQVKIIIFSQHATKSWGLDIMII